MMSFRNFNASAGMSGLFVLTGWKSPAMSIAAMPSFDVTILFSNSSRAICSFAASSFVFDVNTPLSFMLASIVSGMPCNALSRFVTALSVSRVSALP